MNGLSTQFVIEEARTRAALGLPVDWEPILALAQEAVSLEEDCDRGDDVGRSLYEALDNLFVEFSEFLDEEGLRAKIPSHLRKAVERAKKVLDRHGGRFA